MDYAEVLRRRPRKSGARIKKPAVVGGVIDLGRCLNLLDQDMIALVKNAHQEFNAALNAADVEPPRNKGGSDLLQRFLDCAVLQHLHTTREGASLPFDTVRGVFVEGEPIYPSAGFHEKSHIQVCVRNIRCIKGYFRVLPEEEMAQRSAPTIA